MRHGDRGTFNNAARLWSVVLLATLVGAEALPLVAAFAHGQFVTSEEV